MKFHYQIRVKIKGDHLEYGYFMRCEEDHADACMLKTACMIAKKRNVSIGDVTIRITGKSARASKTFGGIAT
jgi:hypothetical protein